MSHTDPARIALLRYCVRCIAATARAERLYRKRLGRQNAAWAQLAAWDADRADDARAAVGARVRVVVERRGR